MLSANSSIAENHMPLLCTTLNVLQDRLAPDAMRGVEHDIATPQARNPEVNERDASPTTRWLWSVLLTLPTAHQTLR